MSNLDMELININNYNNYFKNYFNNYFKNYFNNYYTNIGEKQIKLKTVLAVILFFKYKKIYSIILSIKTSLYTRNFYSFSDIFLKFYKYLPNNKLQQNITESCNSIIKSTIDLRHNYEKHNTLPKNGYGENQLIEKLTTFKNNNNIDLTKVSGKVYNKDDKLGEILGKIFPLFYKSNPLHPDIYPNITQIECDIINICKNLYGGSSDSIGCISSGGTESILLACLAYKNLGLKKNILYPEIVLPSSAHAAFDKAAKYFNIKLVKIPYNNDSTIDLNLYKSCINSNTICLVCSAPSYNNGIIEPYHTIGSYGVKYGIPCHVDACLGGFILPFLEDSYFSKNNIPRLDFKVPGITSISLDSHKYGYSPKGTSILLYSEKKYIHNQYFLEANWSGGIYATSTLSGSRSGNILVLTWATLMYYGLDRYKKMAQNIITINNNIKKLLTNLEYPYKNDIDIIGNPICCVIGLKSQSLNIYELNKYMKNLGWNLSELQKPNSIHLCITQLHINMEEKFITDLKSAINQCKNNRVINKNENKTDVGIYGTTQKINDKSIINDIILCYLDSLYC